MKRLAIFSILIFIAVILDSIQLKLNSVFEPATMILLGVGLIVLSGLRKKFERK